MMSNFTTSSQSHPHRIEEFLKLLDKITEKQGLNVPQIVEIEKLRSLPIGTFGRAWADLLDENNLQPFTTGSRRKQLHDGVHVLTGYSTNLTGEAEVQAFLLGSKFTFLNLMIGLGLLRMIYTNLHSQSDFTWNRLRQAYQRGYQSQFDPDSWQPELLWHLPVIEVQQLFGVFI